MRYIILLAALLASLPICANDTLLADLTAMLQQRGILPSAAKKSVPTRLKIVSLPAGALARWNPKTDTFEVSKSIWKRAPHMVECLLPLFVHETIHTYLYKTAQATGFVWQRAFRSAAEEAAKQAICEALHCQPGDILEYAPETE